MQGIIKSYNPKTKNGEVVDDVDFTVYELAADALNGSIFRMLRPGQRVIFDLEDNLATKLRLGSEENMVTPETI